MVVADWGSDHLGRRKDLDQPAQQSKNSNQPSGLGVVKRGSTNNQEGEPQMPYPQRRACGLETLDQTLSWTIQDPPKGTLGYKTQTQG